MNQPVGRCSKVATQMDSFDSGQFFLGVMISTKVVPFCCAKTVLPQWRWFCFIFFLKILPLQNSPTNSLLF